MKYISFYLPQFHPFKENDEWWGKGFTEWRNVAKGKPRYRGHYQPKLPGDLGYYDLRLPEVRKQQAELAKENGIDGFCYYHYWFNNKILMERPFKEVLDSKEPNFPFCLCWANENWTRAWDGGTKYVLIEQNHSDDDSLAHITKLIEAFKDTRYIKINGKPLLLIYRIDLIPDVNKLIKSWRQETIKNGFPDLHLVAVKNDFVQLSFECIMDLGFNAVVEFQPCAKYFPKVGLIRKLYNKCVSLLNGVYKKIFRPSRPRHFIRNDEKLDYSKIVTNSINQFEGNGCVYPTVFPTWDNSARRVTTKSRIIENTDSTLFQNWIEKMSKKVVDTFSEEEQMLFINAWNEWAEGCYLEPDLVLGDRFLKAVKQAKKNIMKTV